MEDRAEYRTPKIELHTTDEENMFRGAMAVCNIDADEQLTSLLIELHNLVVEKKESLTLAEIYGIKRKNDARFEKIKNIKSNHGN